MKLSVKWRKTWKRSTSPSRSPWGQIYMLCSCSRTFWEPLWSRRSCWKSIQCGLCPGLGRITVPASPLQQASPSFKTRVPPYGSFSHARCQIIAAGAIGCCAAILYVAPFCTCAILSAILDSLSLLSAILRCCLVIHSWPRHWTFPSISGQ